MAQGVLAVLAFLSRWSPKYPYILAYMLQASEYNVREYSAWWLRTRDFRSVMHRKTLDVTMKAKLMLVLLYGLTGIGIGKIGYCLLQAQSEPWYYGVALVSIVAFPFVLAFIIVPFLWVGTVLVQRPKERAIIARATTQAASLSATKIAVAGSYGKTSMKEMLSTVLSQKYKVAATPGNLNTPLGTARFLDMLDGDEDIVIFEYGEGKSGDVKELCDITTPHMGVITGISEAHFESFGSKQAIIDTIFELDEYLGGKNVYRNVDSPMVAQRAPEDDAHNYTHATLGQWSTQNVSSELTGLTFDIVHGAHTIHVTSRLIGEHHVGPLLCCAVIAHSKGLSYEQIEQGLNATKAFEHRMQPYHLGGALIIDDTYNGNPMGMKSGLALLKKAEANRRIYVTPGLVEMGSEADRLHEELGKQIADSADVVVLMKNSATEAIVRGMQAGEFDGELDICEDPLAFYQNIEHYVAVGDVVLMQNDWSDNYN